MTLHVFTATRWVRDPDAFDITRGAGGPKAIPFAPSKAILVPALAARSRAKLVGAEDAARIENGAWAIYEARYRAEMRRSYVEHRAAWASPAGTATACSSRATSRRAGQCTAAS